MNNIYIGENNVRELNIANAKAIKYGDSLSKTKSYYFVMEANIPEDNYTITLVDSSSDTYTDWGDGTKDKESSHIYYKSGTYTIISESYSKDLNIMNKFIIKKDMDCANMFYGSQLTSLPDSFTIPNSVTNCNRMFDSNQLTSIPEGFTIPPSATDISWMFSGNQLKSIPTNFIFPNSITNCSGIFWDNQITTLPEGFTIPPSATDISWMFSGNQLTSLPDGFTILENVTDCSGMFADNQLTSLPSSFTIPSSVTNCGEMFYANENLTGTLVVESILLTTIDSIMDMIYNTQISEIRVPEAFPLTDDEIKANCGKSDITVTRY